MPRLRIRFSRGEELKFISHLDVIRLWERALRRAQIPLAYSAGYSPHPRLSLAAPLAVGVTSEAELMDIFLSKDASPHWFISAVSRQLPRGIDLLGVYPIALAVPALQAQVRYAEYRVKVTTERGQGEVESAMRVLLSRDLLPWQHQRDTGRRSYDLRALIDDLWLVAWEPPYGTIGMRLRCDSGGSGRSEQVIFALGFTHFPHSRHRTRLILEASR